MAGSTKERGYDYQHKLIRQRLAPTIDAGNGWCSATICLEPTRWIKPGTAWDLGHTPDRTAYTGPEHMRCNRLAGAKLGAQRRWGARRRAVIVRPW